MESHVKQQVTKFEILAKSFMAIQILIHSKSNNGNFGKFNSFNNLAYHDKFICKLYNKFQNVHFFYKEFFFK